MRFAFLRLEGSVIKWRMPAYPLTASSMNAYGNVEARIAISEAGQVIEATANQLAPGVAQRGCGCGTRVGLQTDDAQRQPHEGRSRLDFHLCPWFSITKIQPCCYQE
jgi:hypothetical protein